MRGLNLRLQEHGESESSRWRPQDALESPGADRASRGAVQAIGSPAVCRCGSYLWTSRSMLLS